MHRRVRSPPPPQRNGTPYFRAFSAVGEVVGFLFSRIFHSTRTQRFTTFRSSPAPENQRDSVREDACASRFCSWSFTRAHRRAQTEKTLRRSWLCRSQEEARKYNNLSMTRARARATNTDTSTIHCSHIARRPALPSSYSPLAHPSVSLARSLDLRSLVQSSPPHGRFPARARLSRELRLE